MILAEKRRILGPELDVGRVHPWVGLGRVGSQNSPFWVDRVGSGPVAKCLINMQFNARNSSTITANGKKL